MMRKFSKNSISRKFLGNVLHQNERILSPRTGRNRGYGTGERLGELPERRKTGSQSGTSLPGVEQPVHWNSVT